MKARTVLVADVLTRDSETMRTLSLAVESMGIELAMTASVADLSGADLHFRNNPSMPVVTARLTSIQPLLAFSSVLAISCFPPSPLF